MFLLALILVLLLILIYWYAGSIERFDTYGNHDLGAQKVYDARYPGITEDEANLVARYNWRDVNAAGENVYDYYYEDVLQNNANDASYQNYTYDPWSMPETSFPATIFNGEVITLA